MTNDKVRCSFCGKRDDEVAQLIAGPGKVFICDLCIDLCHETITKERERRKRGGFTSMKGAASATLATAARAIRVAALRGSSRA